MANLKDIRNVEKVMIFLGGEEREIKFDLNAFAELENKFGSVDEAMKKMQSGGMGSIKTVLWTGLIHNEAIIGDDGEPTGYKITPYQVGSWITMTNLTEVSEGLTKAMSADLPDQDVKKVQEELKDISLGKGATVVLTKEEKIEAEKNV